MGWLNTAIILLLYVALFAGGFCTSSVLLAVSRRKSHISKPLSSVTKTAIKVFAFVLLVPFFPSASHAQAVELACPAGSAILQPNGQTLNNTTSATRRWQCVNDAGTVVTTISLREFTVATLPSASLYQVKSIVLVTDSATGLCTVGGGTTLALCRSTGSAWVGIGAGGGGGGTPRLDQVLNPNVDKTFSMPGLGVGFSGTEGSIRILPEGANVEVNYGPSPGDIGGFTINSTLGGIGWTILSNNAGDDLHSFSIDETTNNTYKIYSKQGTNGATYLSPSGGNIGIGVPIGTTPSGKLQVNNVADFIWGIFPDFQAGNTPSVIEYAAPNTYTGNFGLTYGSQYNLSVGDDGAAAAGAQSVRVYEADCTSTNGSSCVGLRVANNVSITSGLNAFGGKDAVGVDANTTTNIAAGISDALRGTADCTGAACTSKGLVAAATCSGAGCHAYALDLTGGGSILAGVSPSEGTSGMAFISQGPNNKPQWSSAVTGATFSTTTNCSDSAGAAACGSAAAGTVVIDAAATSVVVSTTAVTANSEIFVQYDSSLGARLSVTCNVTVAIPSVTARSAGVSFTITVPVAPAANPACYSYHIIN